MNQLEQLPIPLLQWFHENARVLPWRSEPTPYHVWVSEVMLQQTRVAAVLGYYARFMQELPDIQALAQVPEERLMKLWQGLGYYNRARNLQKAAQQIMEQYGGRFPDQYAQILSLAGIGAYTAGAIASIAFQIPVPAVDGNVLRVVARITGDKADISLPETRVKVGQAIQAILPRAMPGDFNQALMELGATVCLPNGAPLCDRCPAAPYCVAYGSGQTDILPVRASKKARRIEQRTVLLIFHGGRVALRQRGARGLLAGLWEYPNGLDSAGSLLESWGVQADSLTLAGTGRHIFTHIEWHMQAVAVQPAQAGLPEGWIWADWEQLAHQYAVPNAFNAFLPIVSEYLTGELPWQSCISGMV